MYPLPICLLSYLCSVLSRSVVSDSLWPHGLLPARLLCPWGSPGKNTEMGCHALLQGIFPAQGSNPGLPHCRRILYCLSHLIPYLLICRNSLCVLDTNPLSDLADFFLNIFILLYIIYYLYVYFINIYLFYLAASGLSCIIQDLFLQCSGFSKLPLGMWDLSSPTRDRTCISCIARQILNHWTMREVPGIACRNHLGVSPVFNPDPCPFSLFNSNWSIQGTYFLSL